jgi:hypothetical protein
MNRKDNNIIRFPRRNARAKDMPDDANSSTVADRRALYLHRLQYSLRMVLSVFLMWVQGPIDLVCGWLNVITMLALGALWLFTPASTTVLWSLAGISLVLFLLPLLLAVFIYWLMPTK